MKQEINPFENLQSQERKKEDPLEDIGEIQENQEQRSESMPEQTESTDQQTIAQDLEGLPSGGNTATQTNQQAEPKGEVLVEIEKYMSENIEDAFVQMTPLEQEKFRIEGEKTARNIQEMIQSTKVKVKKVIKLLRNWLKLIPGVNKVFLEQEAKIKADRIIEYAEKKEKERFYQ